MKTEKRTGALMEVQYRHVKAGDWVYGLTRADRAGRPAAWAKVLGAATIVDPSRLKEVESTYRTHGAVILDASDTFLTLHEAYNTAETSVVVIQRDPTWKVIVQRPGAPTQDAIDRSETLFEADMSEGTKVRVLWDDEDQRLRLMSGLEEVGNMALHVGVEVAEAVLKKARELEREYKVRLP